MLQPCYGFRMPRNVSVRELRNHTADVVAAVRRGESVTLTANREPVADIVPHVASPSPWLPSSILREIVQRVPSDPGLLDDLADVRGSVIEDRESAQP